MKHRTRPRKMQYMAPTTKKLAAFTRAKGKTILQWEKFTNKSYQSRILSRSKWCNRGRIRVLIKFPILQQLKSKIITIRIAMPTWRNHMIHSGKMPWTRSLRGSVKLRIGASQIKRIHLGSLRTNSQKENNLQQARKCCTKWLQRRLRSW